MSFIAQILKRPYFVYSFLSVFIMIGMVGYFGMDRNLFPNSNRPQIALVVISPNGSAKDIASNIATPLEEELYTIDKVRRVYSSIVDEVAVINVEFEYSKEISDAANDVKNSFDKIKSKLPSNILEPQLHKITQTTAPVITVSLNSKDLDLFDLRQLAQNELKKEFLSEEGVANVDIFGGFKKELQIVVDKNKLEHYALSFEKIANTIKSANSDYSIGILNQKDGRFLVKSTQKRDILEDIKNISIASGLKLKDIATVSFFYPNNIALYQGNGKDAIALAIQRGGDADVIKTIQKVEEKLQVLKKKYQNINFEITDTQKTTIVQSTQNMFESLKDAIIMSMIVVFVFLASFRQIIVILLTIPVVYISTIALMYAFGIEFNVITLTGVVLALGLLLDDTVVVVENIDRHFSVLKKSIDKAVVEGTDEIMFADFSGTLTTIVAIFPILFVGDYPQTIFAPLISTLLLALVASYVVSVTFVPLISTKILKIDSKILTRIEQKVDRFTTSFNQFLVNFFIDAFSLARNSKFMATLYLAILALLFIVSAKVVMPLAGQELMPSMDTGGVKIKISTDANLPIEETKKVLNKVNKIIKKEGIFVSSSATIGQEAGVLSIGSGGNMNDISIVVNYVNRFERKESIWDIQQDLREEIANIAHIKRLEISEYGSTAMSSIKANLAITLYGEDLNQLYQKALEFEEVFYQTKGIVNVSKSWDIDSKSLNFSFDGDILKAYQIDEANIIKQINNTLKGLNVGSFDIPNTLPLPIVLKYNDKDIDGVLKIQNLLIDTPKGKIPLSVLGRVGYVIEPNIITRENMKYTIDVMGIRQKGAISHINGDFDAKSTHIDIPQDMVVRQTGDLAEFQNSSKRIVKAVAIGLVLIFLVMIPMFESLKTPFLIILSIPLTLVGASWVLLLFDYHSSMSAMIGFILLAGVIVNNAIMIIFFAIEEEKKGLNSFEAMIESIKLRTRPVLMTAISVSVGMMPVAFGWAIGLERLAPLGAVVVGGLIVGTFLTLIFIPLFYVWSQRDKSY